VSFLPEGDMTETDKEEKEGEVAASVSAEDGAWKALDKVSSDLFLSPQNCIFAGNSHDLPVFAPFVTAKKRPCAKCSHACPFRLKVDVMATCISYDAMSCYLTR
jgi:hypothetical protein